MLQMSAIEQRALKVMEARSITQGEYNWFLRQKPNADQDDLRRIQIIVDAVADGSLGVV